MKTKRVFYTMLTVVVTLSLILSSFVIVHAAGVTLEANSPETLKEAFSKVGDNDVINITGDIVMNEGIYRQYGNFKITGTGSVTWTSEKGLNLDACTVTMDGVTLKQAASVASNGDSYLIFLEKTGSAGAKLTINGGNYYGHLTFKKSDNPSAVNTYIINGGKFYQTDYRLFTASVNHTNITINGGEFYGSSSSQPMFFTGTDDATGILDVKGGTFKMPKEGAGAKQDIFSVGPMKRFSFGNSDGTGPSVTYNGEGNIFSFVDDIYAEEFEYSIFGGTFTHNGSGNIIGFDGEKEFSANLTVYKATFKHTGSGSFIDTPVRTSNGFINFNETVFNYTGKGIPFVLAQKCNNIFNGLNITQTSANEIFNVNDGVTVVILNSKIKNNGPVIKVKSGTAEIYTPTETALTSTKGSVITGNHNRYYKDLSKMLVIDYAENSTAVAQTYMELTPGKTYQFDIDYKPASIFMKTDYTIYYRPSSKTKVTTKLKDTDIALTSANLENKHLSLRFTVPDDAKEGEKNICIAFGHSPKSQVGKMIYAFPILRIVENDVAKGDNLIEDPDFSKTQSPLIKDDMNVPWSYYGKDATMTTSYITASFYDALPSPNQEKMWTIGSKANDSWGGIKQEFQIKGNTYYKFSLDKKGVKGATPLIRIGIKGGGSSSYEESDMSKVCSEYNIVDVGTKYIFTFKTKTLFSGNNFRLYLARNDSVMSSDAVAYFAHVSLCEDTSKGKGTSYGENLIFNGDFKFGDFGDITKRNVDVQLFGWDQITDGEMFNTYKMNKLSEIPEDFFAIKNVLSVKNANGTVTQFQTVESGKQYCFSYNNKYESNETATPYIEAFTKNGSVKITPDKVTKDIGGVYNTSVIFTMPNDLIASKNLRIGLRFDDEKINGSFSDFSLCAVDKYGMPIGDNFIKDSGLEKTKSIIDYSPDADIDVWMKEGEFDIKPEIVLADYEIFNIRIPHLMLLAGKNEGDYETTKGLNLNIYQTVSITAGKKYRLTYNAKWAATGRAGGLDKACIELTYNDGNAWKELPNQKTVSDTEYKETCIFTAPSDISSSGNCKVSIWVSSAYVSGYFANFSLVEIDETGKPISYELIKNGDFSTGTNESWTVNGGYRLKQFAEIPENFFGKAKKNNPHMIEYSKTDDFAWYRSHFMLEANTTYEMVIQRNDVKYPEDKKPYSIMYFFYYRNVNGSLSNINGAVSEKSEVPELSNIKVEELANNKIKWTFTTPENFRTHGDGNVYFYHYMRQDGSGYLGETELYKLSGGKRVGNNLFLNGDFSLGDVAWDPMGSMRVLNIEQPYNGYLNKNETPTQMVESLGTSSNATYKSDVIKVDAYKTYRFTGTKIDMNNSGVNPQVLYRSRNSNGQYVSLPMEVYYDSDRFVFEADFTIPSDAVIDGGMADIIVQMNNEKKGKGYFTDLALYEKGKLVNLAGNFKASNSNYKVVKYDDSVFVFYYDDTKFEDGDWSGELKLNDEEETTVSVRGGIRGTILDKDGNPISGAKVILMPGNKTTYTDSFGQYSFSKLKEGTYQLYLVEENGNKLPLFDGLSVSNDVTVIVPTATYMTAGEVSALLTDEEENSEYQGPYGALKGIFYDEDGNPIPNAVIFVRGVGHAVTDKNGIFKFDKVPCGKYELYTVLADDKELVLRTVEIKPNLGISIAVSLPSDDSFNWLWVIIPAAAVVLAAGVGVFVIILVKKKKKEKQTQ